MDLNQSYQLYRTNIYLGGQMKYDLVVSGGSDVLVIDDLHITPITDNTTPYGKNNTEDLLNYANQENIRNFYQQTSGSFYNTFVNPSVSNEYPMIPDPARADGATKNYDDSVFSGCSRMASYNIYNKQFQILVPLWLEVAGDIYFDIHVNTPDGIELVHKKVEFSDRLRKYFEEYFKFIELDNRLIKIDLDGDCTVHGLDVHSGTMTTFKDFNILYNITSRERPLIEFNSMIINMLKNNTTIVKQLFNFNLCFNIEDISEELAGSYGVFNITCDTYLNGVKLAVKDMFTNFDNINKENISRLDADSFVIGIKKFEHIEKPDTSINVLDYKQDNLNLDIINANKVDQKYIHWSLCDNNEYIFNLYDGWAGAYISSNDDRFFSHTYKSAPILGVDKPVRDMNLIYWCNYVFLNTSQLGNLKRRAANIVSIISACSSEIVYSGNDSGYLNHMRYKYPSKYNDKTYHCISICNNSTNWYDDVFKKGIRIDTESDSDIHLYIYDEGHDIYLITTVTSDDKLYMKEFLRVLNNSKNNYAEFYKAFFNNPITPKTVNIYRSILPVRCAGPTKDTMENTYYKINESYHQYLLRYDGYIRPTFIDTNSNEYNYVYYKDILSTADDETNVDEDKRVIYEKYIRGKFPPKYPSINYYPLTRKKLTYDITVSEMKNLVDNKCEIKWFGRSTVLALPYSIHIEQSYDKMMDIDAIAIAYLGDRLGNDGYPPRYIVKMYDIMYNISRENENYYYTLDLRLK